MGLSVGVEFPRCSSLAPQVVTRPLLPRIACPQRQGTPGGVWRVHENKALTGGGLDRPVPSCRVQIVKELGRDMNESTAGLPISRVANWDGYEFEARPKNTFITGKLAQPENKLLDRRIVGPEVKKKIPEMGIGAGFVSHEWGGSGRIGSGKSTAAKKKPADSGPFQPQERTGHPNDFRPGQ